MQANKNTSDLEYLAGLGFEKIPYNDADIEELKTKIKQKRKISVCNCFLIIYEFWLDINFKNW